MNITLLQMKNISYFIFVRWLLLILGNICLIIIVACYKYGPKYRYWVINCQTILPLKLHLVWYPWKMSSNSFFICSFICNVTWTLLSKNGFCMLNRAKLSARRKQTHLSIVLFDRKWLLPFNIFMWSQERQVYCFFIR